MAMQVFTGTGWVNDEKAAMLYSSMAEAQAKAAELGCNVRKLLTLHPDYRPMRSLITASPGMVLLEADWNQAELWTLGSLSNDQKFLNVLRTTDVHTDMLRRMFGSLQYRDRLVSDWSIPELKGFAGQDKLVKSWRTAAKAVNFGIPYKRGAAAIIRQIEEEGVRGMTKEQAQDWIDLFYNTYEDIAAFLGLCQRQVLDPRYLVNPYGRRRRFPFTMDRDLIAEYQREAVNFPIQSTVGDSMSRALWNFWVYQRAFPQIPFRLLLSIHDAVLMECEPQFVAPMIERVIPACMVDGVEVPGCGLHYGIGDIDVQLRYGEKTKPDVLAKLGVAEKYCGFKKAA